MKTSRAIFWLWLALPGFAAWAADSSNPPPPVHQAPAPPPLVAPQEPVQPAALAPAARAASPAAAPASPAPAIPVPAKVGAADLEKLVAPIALYPDPLIAAVLPASAYPIEVVLAARFVKDPQNLAKLDQQPWDESVKTVARFPEVIQKMNDNLSWTVELGQAFVVQQQDVMNAVQTMRGKAQASGALKTTPEQTVIVNHEVVAPGSVPEPVYVANPVIQIQPAQADVIYVPQYNPAVVYGPAPAYYYDPFVPFVSFGLGVWFGSAYWGQCNWYNGWVGCPAYRPPYYYAGYPPPGGGHPPPGGGQPPPGGGQPPPGGGQPPPGGRQRPPGGGQPPASGPQAAAAKPWQADASRLRAAGTRGSLASVQSRDPTAWRLAAGNPAARPALAAQPGTASRSTQLGAGVHAAQPLSGKPQPAGGTRPAPSASIARPVPSPSPGVSRAAAASPGTGRAVASSQAGGLQRSVANAPRPVPTGGSFSRPSAAPNVWRPSASASLSRPAPSFSARSSGSAYSRPSIGSSPGAGGLRGFSSPAAAPSFGGSRSFNPSPSFGGGGFRGSSGGGWSGGRGGGGGGSGMSGGFRGGHR